MFLYIDNVVVFSFDAGDSLSYQCIRDLLEVLIETTVFIPDLKRTIDL